MLPVKSKLGLTSGKCRKVLGIFNFSFFAIAKANASEGLVDDGEVYDEDASIKDFSAIKSSTTEKSSTNSSVVSNFFSWNYIILLISLGICLYKILFSWEKTALVFAVFGAVVLGILIWNVSKLEVLAFRNALTFGNFALVIFLIIFAGLAAINGKDHHKNPVTY